VAKASAVLTTADVNKVPSKKQFCCKVAEPSKVCAIISLEERTKATSYVKKD